MVLTDSRTCRQDVVYAAAVLYCTNLGTAPFFGTDMRLFSAEQVTLPRGINTGATVLPEAFFPPRTFEAIAEELLIRSVFALRSAGHSYAEAVAGMEWMLTGCEPSYLAEVEVDVWAEYAKFIESVDVPDGYDRSDYADEFVAPLRGELLQESARNRAMLTRAPSPAEAVWVSVCPPVTTPTAVLDMLSPFGYPGASLDAGVVVPFVVAKMAADHSRTPLAAWFPHHRDPVTDEVVQMAATMLGSDIVTIREWLPHWHDTVGELFEVASMMCGVGQTLTAGPFD